LFFFVYFSKPFMCFINKVAMAPIALFYTPPPPPPPPVSFNTQASTGAQGDERIREM
jgi:hypothetical protein